MKGRWTYIVSILVGLLLFVLSSGLRFMIQASRITDVWSYGFPFTYYEAWGPCPSPGTCQEFLPLALVLDILIWIAFGVGAVIVARRGRRR